MGIVALAAVLVVAAALVVVRPFDTPERQVDAYLAATAAGDGSHALDAWKDDDTISIRTQHQLAFLDPTNFRQRVIVKKVKVVSRFQYCRDHVWSNSIAQNFNHVRVAIREMRPGVVVGQVKGDVVRGLALPQ